MCSLSWRTQWSMQGRRAMGEKQVAERLQSHERTGTRRLRECYLRVLSLKLGKEPRIGPADLKEFMGGPCT